MAISLSDSDLDDDNDFAETHEINVTRSTSSSSC